MADFMQLNVTGLDGVLETLKQLPAAVVSKRGGPVKFAMAKGARMLRDAIRAAAPEDKGVLKKSISIGRKKLMPNGELGEAYWVGPSKKYHKYANTRFNRGSRTKRGKQRDAQVGKAYVSDGPAYYGKFLEYGSKHQAAHPWLRPAAEANAQRIVDTVNTELLARVDRLVKAIARANGVPK